MRDGVDVPLTDSECIGTSPLGLHILSLACSFPVMINATLFRFPDTVLLCTTNLIPTPAATSQAIRKNPLKVQPFKTVLSGSCSCPSERPGRCSLDKSSSADTPAEVESPKRVSPG